MRKRFMGFGVGAVMVVLAVTTPAEQRATILLRSGTRVSGDFEDIQNDLVYLRVSRDDEQRIPVGRIAIIDFVDGTRGLPRDEVDGAKGSEDVMILRSGTTWTGKMEDVYREGEGSERTIANAAIEVSFRRDDGRTERVAIGRVKRIYLGAVPNLSKVEGALAGEPTPEGAEAKAAEKPTAPEPFVLGRPGDVVVVAATQWTATQIVVQDGDQLTFRGSGEITIGPNETVTPDGSRTGRLDPAAPLPQVLAGALIARVGGRLPFGVGTQTNLMTMSGTGELYLGINESSVAVADNTGAFKVTVTMVGRRR